MKVEEIMKRAIAVEEIKLKEAAEIMSEKRVGSLIIMRGENIVGIITERDVLKNVGRLNEKISKIMSKDVITISPDSSLDDAAKTMTENEIKRLPVVEKGKLVGIITATDLIANSDALNENFFLED
ncbi:MAG: CBS domain-containing protein [Flavobacterium sp.]|uniref:CBS domain-containing protein n=1 Tax=Flavobacterium sp. TaxID=239 RepID=UPI00260A3A11|nr:CBS domain-containing protein [Flavobacterium sp.]MDD5151259.1 CBS domain-containing protein [Flavobacterium sp.]